MQILCLSQYQQGKGELGEASSILWGLTKWTVSRLDMNTVVCRVLPVLLFLVLALSHNSLTLSIITSGQ